MIIVDVGASIGIFTLYVAKLVENGIVVSIEPEAESFLSLVQNVRVNNFQNVIPINVGLWSSKASLPFYKSSDFVGSSVFGYGNSKSIELQVLDDVLDELKLENVDVVKIDAEGAELEILLGSQRHIYNIKNFEISAYHSQDNLKDLVGLLKDYGFLTFVRRHCFLIPYIFATRDTRTAHIRTFMRYRIGQRF